VKLTLCSEEQQPLENFFRAKGIKTKNEMADDVSDIIPCLAQTWLT
jgi:structure-specific recognition protein 1